MSVSDYYRTGVQDCGNVFSIDEFEDSAAQGGTPEQIYDRAVPRVDPTVGPDYEEFNEWIDQMGGLEDFDAVGDDPMECYIAWRRGWRVCAIDNIRRYFGEGPTSTGVVPNPTLDPVQILRRFRDLMANPDPNTVVIAQDLLLDNGVSLAEVSRQFLRDMPMPARELIKMYDVGVGDAGVFRLPPGDVGGYGDPPGSTKISWALQGETSRRGSRTTRYMPIIVITFRDVTWKVGHQFVARGTRELAMREALEVAWHAVDVLKHRLGAAVDDVRWLSFINGDPIPKELLAAGDPKSWWAGTSNWGEDNEPTANPAVGPMALMRRFRDLLRDPDPATVPIIEDLLLENETTLAEQSMRLRSSARFPSPGDDEYAPDDDYPVDLEDMVYVDRELGSLLGAFPLATGVVSWAVERTSSVYMGNEYVPRVAIYWPRGGHTGLGGTFEISNEIAARSPLYRVEYAIAKAVDLAWRAAVVLKQRQNARLEDIRNVHFITEPVTVPDAVLGAPPKRNPARSIDEVQQTFEALLLELDRGGDITPSTSAAQDLLLENEITLAEVSSRTEDVWWRPNVFTENSERAGLFVITKAGSEKAPWGHIDAASDEGVSVTGEGVAWWAVRSTTGPERERWFSHVRAIYRRPSAHDDSRLVMKEQMIWTTSGRHHTLEAAVALAVRQAWRATIVMKRTRAMAPSGAALPFADSYIHSALESLDRTNEVIPHDLIRGYQQVAPGSDVEESAPVENPAWTTNVLADAFESLGSQIPAEWMPKLSSVRGGPRNTIVAELKEYGCGAYGCVLPTLTDAVVLKVTTDPTEAEFASQLAADLVKPVCVAYYMAVSLNARHKGLPIYVLWRESADDVGKLAEKLGPHVADAIHVQHRAAQEVFAAFHESAPSGEVDKLVAVWRRACRAMGRSSDELGALATGMIHVFDRQQIFFGDIHEGNLGRVYRGKQQAEWVITDPGHVAVIQ